MKLVAFDIETGPESPERLALSEPVFEAPSNYKDKEKIAAYKSEKREQWVKEAALSPMTGRILAIGWGQTDASTNIAGLGFTDPGDPDAQPLTEKDLITDFFEIYSKAANGDFYLVGFNIHGFDLPFIVKRAWILGVPVPYALRPNGQSRFFWPPCFIDLQQIWGAGEYRAAGSLGAICALLGIGTKNTSGADFASLYENETTRELALGHLRNDLNLTLALSERLLG